MKDDDIIRPEYRRPPRASALSVLLAAGLSLGVLGTMFAVAKVTHDRKVDSADEEKKRDRARGDVKMIGDACTSFNVRYGRYPESLDELVEPPNGGRAYFKEDKLVDPWGNRYQYDLTTCHPTTGEPLVFTTAPKGDRIRNWSR